MRAFKGQIQTGLYRSLLEDFSKTIYLFSIFNKAD